MKELFYMGGTLFMSILTAILIIMVAWAIYHSLPFLTGKNYDLTQTRMRIRHIRTIGLFGLMFGISGNLIGLFQAFDAIEQMGDVSPALLMGGLKVSMITTFYGIFIFLLSLLVWFILDYILSRNTSGRPA
jgi:hypothetical protein